MQINLEHELYRDLTFPKPAEHPQRQGMSQDEFEAALDDPMSVISDVATPDGLVRIPQIVGLDMCSWNNTGFYRTRYPRTDIRQLFVPLHSGEMPENVLSGVQELVGSGGVLIVEVPSTALGGIEAITTRLRSGGVDLGEPDLLGTQTYFEGKISLNDQSKVSSTPTRFTEIFTAAAREGVDSFGKRASVDRENGVWAHQTLPTDDADELFEFYEDAYVVLNNSPLHQGLDPDMFREMIATDTTATKFVYRIDGKAQTLFISTEDIDGLDWVSSDYYREHFHDDYTNKDLLWFPGIATDPHAKSLHNGQRITHLMTKLSEMGGYEPRIVFDFCDFNTDIGLHNVIARWVNNTAEASVAFSAIANQKYYGLRLNK